ncbi:LysR substrate-binding domain-containing protein [Microbacterium yannicii]|uniref:LysR substrate-binding domain-containing protein n=1 Tax=Microbacterium yannicii TaxID=671622 RepID=A0ABP9M9T3_9MICO|nr:LysR substrate-binding domain-containing protein [Microbacterium yannicii]MCO5952655.1 LysR substrate-binding domain-containing protein [Microbacterium yannicii]
MAKGGSRTGGRGRDAAGTRRGAASGSAAKAKPAKPRNAQRPQPSPGPSPTPPAQPPMPTTFLLGAIPGATPGKWIDTWKERMPRTSLELVPLAFADQRQALVEGEVDAALVRLPIDKEGLHVIPLYDEVPVVVCAKDSHLTAAAELDTADLVGEVLIVPQDDVLGIRAPGTEKPRFAPPADTGEAIATVAAGVGIVVVPMSLARLHQRKDVEYRPLLDGPASTVALAWPAERTTPAVDAFVGIVRGRTANSSRA